MSWVRFGMVEHAPLSSNDKSLTKYLILGWVADESLCVIECHITGRCSVTLIVCNNLDFSMLEDSNAGVSSSKIDTDRLAHDLSEK